MGTTDVINETSTAQPPADCTATTAEAEGATSPVARTSVCGVFKGGGAKGVAYAGALRALEDEQKSFDAVAGASAGAITAALIAAGLTSESVITEMSAALSGVRLKIWRAILSGSSLYNTDDLRDWLDGLLRARVGFTESTARVTFRQLHEAKAANRDGQPYSIELFVLATNLQTKAPIIFNEALTPDLSVADAVLASCAIPGALPNGRLVSTENGNENFRVDAIVDGGAYANFPEFVFCDESFRLWYQKERERVATVLEASGTPKSTEVSVLDDDCRRDVYGFVLNDHLNHAQPAATAFIPNATKLAACDRGTSKTAGTTAQWIFSEFLGGNIARLAAAGLTTTVLVLTCERLPDVYQWTNTHLPGSWADVSVVRWLLPLIAIAIPALLFAMVLALTALMIGAVLVGRVVSTVVLPAGAAALGVSTGVAPWLGEVSARSRTSQQTAAAADDSPSLMWSLTVIEVPTSGISTMAFRMSPSERNRAVDVARQCVGYQLGLRRDPPPGDLVWKRTARNDTQSRKLASLKRALQVILQVAAAGLMFCTALELLHQSSVERRLGFRWLIIGGALLLGLASLAVLTVLARMGANRSAERSDRIASTQRSPIFYATIALGVCAIGGSVFIGQWLAQRASDQYDVRIVQGLTVDGGEATVTKWDDRDGREVSTGAAVIIDDFEVDIDEWVSVDEETHEISQAFGREDRFTAAYTLQRVGALLAAIGIGCMLFVTKESILRRHRELAAKHDAISRLDACRPVPAR